MTDLARQILQQYPQNCQPNSLTPLGGAGGFSGAEFWQIESPLGRLALRCWPPQHPTAERLAWIQRVLEHATQRGPKVLPVPIKTWDGESFYPHQGRLWELTEWLPGEADFRDAPSRERLSAAMHLLADFHLATADFCEPAPGQLVAPAEAPAPAVEQRLTGLRELRCEGTGRLRRALAADSGNDPLRSPLVNAAEGFLTLLPDVVPRAVEQLEPFGEQSFALQPAIRDVHADHVLFTGNEVTGLVDFSALRIDTIAVDVARLLGSLVDDDTEGWQRGLAAYEQVRPLADQEWRVVRVLDAAGTVLAGCNWIRWLWLERRSFDAPGAVEGRFLRLLQRLEYLVMS